MPWCIIYGIPRTWVRSAHVRAGYLSQYVHGHHGPVPLPPVKRHFGSFTRPLAWEMTVPDHLQRLEYPLGGIPIWDPAQLDPFVPNNAKRTVGRQNWLVLGVTMELSD